MHKIQIFQHTESIEIIENRFINCSTEAQFALISAKTAIPFIWDKKAGYPSSAVENSPKHQLHPLYKG